ncbi:MAG TPA: AAA family ATPase [Longimicrobium sp.]|jgi:hypothetical protein
MSLPEILRDLDLLVRSRHPLVLLDSAEEDRAGALLRELSAAMGLPLFTWSLSRGIRRDGGDAVARPDAARPAPRAEPDRDPMVTGGWSTFSRGQVPLDAFRRTEPHPERAGGTPYDTTHPVQALHHVELADVAALYHFTGLGAHLGDPLVAAKLRDAAGLLQRRGGTLFVTGVGVELPDALRPIASTVRLPLPTPAEYRRVLREVVTELSAARPLQVTLTQEEVTRLLNAMRGMGIGEARKALTRAILEDGSLSSGDIPAVLRAKAEAVAREGLLEFVPVGEEEGAGGVAGLGGLKAWLAKRARVLSDPARAAQLGLAFPRGVLLLGVPGCGKSLSARMVAREWGLPLLRMDPGALYDKYVGESERNFRRALQAAEKLAPAVLWIDEIEKAFQGGGDADGGVSTRILGSFLSWMQDRPAHVFVVATANDVARLPPELLRKGRFDELFFVDLPDPEARREIFAVHLRRRRQDPAAFDLAALAEAADGFSGAEIEEAVVSSLYNALAADGTVTTAALRGEIAATRPLSRIRAEDVARLRAWARDRTVSAA